MPVLFDHVACGVRGFDEIAPLLERDLGARPHRGGPAPSFRGRQWWFDGEGRLELIEPDGPPDGFLHRFIASRGPGIHHVTFKLPSIHEARDRATSLGYDVVGFDDSHPAWKECFLHPKQAGGIVVQMVQSDPSIESEGFQPFAASYTGPASRTVRLVGARMISRDRERTHRLWVELLGARFSSATDTPGTTGTGAEIFSWSESPLTIRVIYDRESSFEGPVGLEMAALGAAPPEALPALLGANLISV